LAEPEITIVCVVRPSAVQLVTEKLSALFGPSWQPCMRCAQKSSNDRAVDIHAGLSSQREVWEVPRPLTQNLGLILPSGRLVPDRLSKCRTSSSIKASRLDQVRQGKFMEKC